MRSRTSTVAALVAVTLTGLACGGVGSGGAGPGDPAELEFASQKGPVPDDGPAAAEGLGAELRFPVGGGDVRVSDDKHVEVLHVSAFDAGYQWSDYKARLEEEGWVWKPTNVPPFEGIFEKDRKRILLSCELAGTSVWVRARRL
ncbi:MAG: hypothetical protein H6737_10200 [Alphaproteobacteria bacterium]|nr:hypothetical protein [Alphaproteobacteria bacterium]